jgi:aspartyl/asparaginyl beta-hydroxylase (cupin superfamily)
VAGRCVVFNDFLEHEAWNATSGERIVLVVDLWHPDLSEAEIRMLESFHMRILHQAANLQRYWADNDRARAEQA